MKKALLVFIVALFVATGTTKAQYFVWDGDFIMGFSAGAVMPFSVPQPDLTGISDVKPGSAKRMVSPIFGFYYGMEREIKGRANFGFNFDLSFSRERAGITYMDSVNQIALSQKSNVLEISEEVFFAYYITEKLPVMAGIGIAESLTFGRTYKKDILDLGGNMISEGKYASSDGYSMGGALSLQASVGAFYYFTNTFFVALRLKMRYPFLNFFSSGANSADAYMTDIPVTLTPIATIGFRW